jgi:hypothetical protein
MREALLEERGCPSPSAFKKEPGRESKHIPLFFRRRKPVDYGY